MSNIEQALGDYPLLGGLISIGQLALGYIIQHTIEMPLIVMQLFQMAAWGGAAVAGFITAIGYYKQNIKKK